MTNPDDSTVGAHSNPVGFVFRKPRILNQSECVYDTMASHYDWNEIDMLILHLLEFSLYQ